MSIEETGKSTLKLENGSLNLQLRISIRLRHIWIFLAITAIPALIATPHLAQDLKVLLIEGLIGAIQILLGREKS